MSSLRKKLEALEAALGSPGDTAAGLARRLVKESPTPSLLFKTPKLSTPTGQTKEIDLDTSSDLFATPEPPKKRSRHEEQKRTNDNIFRTSSGVGKSTSSATLWTVSNELVGKHAASATFRNSRNPTGKPGVGVSSLLLNSKPSTANANGDLRKKIPFGVTVNFSQSSVFREGYNGLGGHEKVVIPPARTKHSVVFKKPTVGSKMKQFFGPSKTAQAPPLPCLDDSD